MGDVVRQHLRTAAARRRCTASSSPPSPTAQAEQRLRHPASTRCRPACQGATGQTRERCRHFLEKTDKEHGAGQKPRRREYGIGVRATAKGIGGTGHLALWYAASAVSCAKSQAVTVPPRRTAAPRPHARLGSSAATTRTTGLWWCYANGTPGKVAQARRLAEDGPHVPPRSPPTPRVRLRAQTRARVEGTRAGVRQLPSSPPPVPSRTADDLSTWAPSPPATSVPPPHTAKHRPGVQVLGTVTT